MITGIDRPTSGEVYVGDTAVHEMSEGEMAVCGWEWVSNLRVVTAPQDAATQERVAQALEKNFRRAGIQISEITTGTEMITQNTAQTDVLVSFLLVMAVLISLVGAAILNSPLDFVFSLDGFLIWLAGVLVLSALASLLPAHNAARLTIREVLAYE